MRKLLEFIRSVYVVVLFVVLEAIAISYYAHSTYYTQARLLARSNQLVGGVHGLFAGVRHYFSLGRENRELLAHVARMKERLALYEEAETAARLDGYMQDIGVSKYRIMTASVTSNTVNRAQNLIVLNRGRATGSPKRWPCCRPTGPWRGMSSTARSAMPWRCRYSTPRSGPAASSPAPIISARSTGTGGDQHTVVLDELSKYADPQPGQEVVTTGFSQYFPADVLIGWVESAHLNETRTAYRVHVRLAAEMTRLTDVILVENRDLTEVRELQNSEKVEQHTRQNR